jgi:hypothetical protein
MLNKGSRSDAPLSDRFGRKHRLDRSWAAARRPEGPLPRSNLQQLHSGEPIAPPQGARPVRHRPPVGRPRPRLGASRVACAFLVYVLSRLPRRSHWRHCIAHPSGDLSLPRKGCRVGLRIVLFYPSSRLFLNAGMKPISRPAGSGIPSRMTRSRLSGRSLCRLLLSEAPAACSRLQAVCADPRRRRSPENRRGAHPLPCDAVPPLVARPNVSLGRMSPDARARR